MIPDARRSLSRRDKNGPIPCATNAVGMEDCAETMMRGFSGRLSVLVPSPYAYQKTFSYVPAKLPDHPAKQIAERLPWNWKASQNPTIEAAA